MISNEESRKLEQEWIEEGRPRIGERPGGHSSDRIERQRGRKLRCNHGPVSDSCDDDAGNLESLIDAMGD
jgi:hypothetical protein